MGRNNAFCPCFGTSPAVALSLWGLVCPVCAGVRMIGTHLNLAQPELLAHPQHAPLCPTTETRVDARMREWRGLPAHVVVSHLGF